MHFTAESLQPSDAELHERLLDASLGEEVDIEISEEAMDSSDRKVSKINATLNSVSSILEDVTGEEEDKGAERSSWQNLLPMPRPVFLSLLVGGAAGGLLGLRLFLELLGFLCILAPLLYRFAMQKIARYMKEYVELEDREMFGVDIHIRALDLSVCYGRLIVYDMLVDNPEGYKSKYMLKAKRILVDLDMMELIRTGGRHIVVEEMSFDEVHAIIEYDSMLFGTAFGTSNFQKVREFMQKKSKAPTPADAEAPPEEVKETASREWTFQKVAFIDVGANMSSQLSSMRVACADLRFKNFSDEMGTKKLSDLLAFLLSTITKTILSSMIHL